MRACHASLFFSFLCLLGTPALVSSVSSRVSVSNFSAGGLDDWVTRSFKGETRYELVETSDGAVLSAHSQATASGLTRIMYVDLTKTPYLNWSWRVNDIPQGLQEQTREGDDYAARVYVLDAGAFPMLPDRSVNYVWSGSQMAGTNWVNAYTDKVRMLALRGPEHEAGVWHHEKRNVREDFQRLFGIDVTNVEAVALMTDTDDSGLEASALYGEIYFTPD